MASQGSNGRMLHCKSTDDLLRTGDLDDIVQLIQKLAYKSVAQLAENIQFPIQTFLTDFEFLRIPVFKIENDQLRYETAATVSNFINQVYFGLSSCVQASYHPDSPIYFRTRRN